MITIDGSYGEGGGQIIRTAVGLAIVTGTDININNIRKQRPKPGLKAQHLTAIKTAAAMTGATVSGVRLGSTEVTFRPQRICGGGYTVDIGTAGSITLLLQCLMPAASALSESLILDITGGTDTAWSPPIDYFTHIFLPLLTAMGYDCDVQVDKRGYYPIGGGRVSARINPCRLTGLDITRKCDNVMGMSHSSRLPLHVARRQADSAAEALERAGYSSSIEVETADYVSTGSGITLWCGSLGGSSLGKRGLPAEKVGRSAAMEIITELDSGAAVDVHLADQLIPYLGLAGRGSYTVREITEHTRTNIWVVEQFLDVTFQIKSEKRGFKILL